MEENRSEWYLSQKIKIEKKRKTIKSGDNVIHLTHLSITEGDLKEIKKSFLGRN